jgi:RNA-binding protein
LITLSFFYNTLISGIYRVFLQEKRVNFVGFVDDAFTPESMRLNTSKGETRKMLTKKQKLRIRKEFSTEKPTMWIGKNGITDAVIKELIKQLEKNEVVKIKLLESVLKKNSTLELAEQLTKTTESILIEIRGNNLILFRKHKL